MPSIRSEWMWNYWNENGSSVDKYMKANYKPGFRYQVVQFLQVTCFFTLTTDDASVMLIEEFGPMFTGDLFNATTFAEIIRHSGAKYFVITSKHHEGYTMWPSKYSWGWNSADLGPKRDFIGIYYILNFDVIIFVCRLSFKTQERSVPP